MMTMMVVRGEGGRAGEAKYIPNRWMAIELATDGVDQSIDQGVREMKCF